MSKNNILETLLSEVSITLDELFFLLHNRALIMQLEYSVTLK